MNRSENLQKLLKKYCQHQQASMQYTERRRRGERRGKMEGNSAGNKSKGQKNHLTTTSWAKLNEREGESGENKRETSQNSQYFYNDTIKGVKGSSRMKGGGGV